MSKDIFEEVAFEDLPLEEGPSSKPTIFDPFGRIAIRLNNNLGAIVIFFLRAFVMIFRIKQIPEILHQIYFIGARSATIVMLVGLFTGMVMGLQLYYVLIKFGSAGVLGTAVSLSLIRELGPVLTAIMITARAGSAMTAEIGIQRISEQIDALQTMRSEFIELYRLLLEKNYMGQLLKYTDEKVVFDRQTMLSEKKAEVDSNIVSSDKKIPITYRLIRRDGDWKVYDLVIEGISLVSNYRTQFNDILSRQTPTEMLVILRKKVTDKSG